MIKKSRPDGRRPSKGGRPLSPRFRARFMTVLDVALLVTSAAAVIYTVAVAGQALGGYTQESRTPQYVMRLEVVDASGDGNLRREALRQIGAVADGDLAIEVVETRGFDLHESTESFVVSRQADCRAACRLAERLGLNPDEVEYKPLVNNGKQITATLVLGTGGLDPAAAVALAEEN